MTTMFRWLSGGVYQHGKHFVTSFRSKNKYAMTCGEKFVANNTSC